MFDQFKNSYNFFRRVIEYIMDKETAEKNFPDTRDVQDTEEECWDSKEECKQECREKYEDCLENYEDCFDKCEEEEVDQDSSAAESLPCMSDQDSLDRYFFTQTQSNKLKTSNYYNVFLPL